MKKETIEQIKKYLTDDFEYLKESYYIEEDLYLKVIKAPIDDDFDWIFFSKYILPKLKLNVDTEDFKYLYHSDFFGNIVLNWDFEHTEELLSIIREHLPFFNLKEI